MPPEIETKIYSGKLKGRNIKDDERSDLRERYNETDDISPEDQELLTFQVPSREPKEDDELSSVLFKYWDVGGEKESDNILLQQLRTPNEEALSRKMSIERTQPAKAIRTPEERKEAYKKLDKEIEEILSPIDDEFITTRIKTTETSTEGRGRERPRKDGYKKTSKNLSKELKDAK